MSSLVSVGIALAFAFPLYAQAHQPGKHQLVTYQGHDQAVRLAMNYCDVTDNFSEEHQPRIFARSASATDAETLQWRQFSNRDEWEAAGRHSPLVLVWDRNGTVVRVTVVSSPPRVWNPLAAYRRAEYCYGADAKLIRIRAVWYVPTHCEFLLPCQLIRGHEFILGQNPGITDWLFMPDGRIWKLWNGKTRNDHFDPTYSLKVGDLHLRKSDDLPFNHEAASN